MSVVRNITPIVEEATLSKLLKVAESVGTYYSVNSRDRTTPLPQARELLTFAHKLERVTNREFEVFERVLNGFTAIIIGEQLGISPRTVDVHKARFIKKMEISNMVKAARYFTALETLIAINDQIKLPIRLAKTG